MAINISIIDSGVNPWHSHVQGIEGGIAFRLGASGKILKSKDFYDELGHGTAIAGIIREKFPAAGLHAVKIFYKALEAPMALLLMGLEWAIKRHFKIIHLSLGTERDEYRRKLDKLCRQAFERNIVIVAAARSPDDHVFPGSFDTVIGVCGNQECDEGSLIYHPGKTVEFGACGRPRSLPHLPQEFNFHGSSFAAARVTAMAAQFLEQNPCAGILEVKEILKKTAMGATQKDGEKKESGQKEIFP